MKKMTNVVSVAAILILMLSFADCSKQENDGNGNGNDPPQDTTDLYPCWTKLENMKNSRNTHMVTVVDNMIYVTGGAVKGSPTNSIEKYDLSSNSWSTKANMPTEREFVRGCAVNGKIYAIGGWADDKTFNVVEEYDPATNRWSSKSPMPTKRWGHVTIELDDKIYVIGGVRDWPIVEYYKTIEIFDPQTDTWSTITRQSETGITPRWGYSACMANGKIYLMGGVKADYYPPSGESIPAMDIVEEYDPATNVWKLKASMPTARWGLNAVTVNNKIYAVGGGDTYEALKTYDIVEMYDPVTDTWVTKSPMPKGRIAAAACELDNMIYVTGGGGIFAFDSYSDFFVYDPSCDTKKE